MPPKGAPAISAKAPVTVSGLFHVQASTLFGQNGPSAPTADTLRIRRAEVKLPEKLPIAFLVL